MLHMLTQYHTFHLLPTCLVRKLNEPYLPLFSSHMASLLWMVIIHHASEGKSNWIWQFANKPYCYENLHPTWDHSVTCHPAEVIFLPLPNQLMLVLYLATHEGCEAELNCPGSWLG